MAPGFQRRPDSSSDFLEILVMMQEQHVNHFMLKGVCDLLRENLMIFPPDLYFILRGREGTGNHHSGGVGYFGSDQTALKTVLIESVKHHVKLYHRRQGARCSHSMSRIGIFRNNLNWIIRTYGNWRKEIIICLRQRR